MPTSIASGARALASRAPSAPRRASLRQPDRTSDGGKPSTLAQQLNTARGDLQTRLDTRLQDEIRLLTVRYSGDTALAERVARDRMARNFAASDPDFAGEIAPLQAKVSQLEEQVRRAAQRRSAGTIGGNGGEKLG